MLLAAVLCSFLYSAPIMLLCMFVVMVAPQRHYRGAFEWTISFGTTFARDSALEYLTC